MKRVLVTGASGYIGSHLVRYLSSLNKYDIYFMWKHNENDLDGYGKYALSYSGDVSSDGDLKELSFKHGSFDTVIHLAAKVSVAESMEKPYKYFDTNVNGTYNVLDIIQPENFIFASTAAAFNPISPYALSKSMCEHIIRQKAENYTIFRFFNVAGSDGVNRQIGPATHIIRVAAEVAAGKRPYMELFGTDYHTFDGTCIRDYIHVLDLVEAIERAIDRPKNTKYECLGSGDTYSNRQVINTMKEVSGIDFEVREAPRRPGDVDVLCVPEGEEYDLLTCRRTLEDMCLSAYRIEQQ